VVAHWTTLSIMECINDQPSFFDATPSGGAPR
jgi:hypothetical protein